MYLVISKISNSLELKRVSLVTILITAFCLITTIKLHQMPSTMQITPEILSQAINQLNTISIIHSPTDILKHPNAIKTHKPNKKLSRIPIHSVVSLPTAKEQNLSKIIIVRSGDNLATIFKREQIANSDYREFLLLNNTTTFSKNLRPGQIIKATIDKDYHVLKLTYNINDAQYLQIERINGILVEKILQRDLIKRIQMATATIQSSLSVAANEIHLPHYYLQEFIDIFHWKINFSRQVHAGDSFKIVYEEYVTDHQKFVKHGEILAAEFATRNNVYQFIRYTDSRGHTDYYSPEGNNVRTTFLRIPIQYTRISSPFNKKRVHPILQIVRPHEGVDFAAPIGTPIKASSNGRIIFKGRKGGYGKTVIIRHNSKYTTLYAHLSHFAKGIHVNSRVKRGKVIGYVGQTGFATGPHLHYEFRIHGIPHDPMGVALPKAQPIPRTEKKRFLQHAQQMIQKLNQL